jgi:NAD(P)-dependent dehydrogenase (short-subunit alcohol dehydrogenase family)
MASELKDKAILVSGGSGHLGRHLISALLSSGAFVINISSKKIDEDAIGANSGNFLQFIADLNLEDEVMEVRDALSKELVIDGLLNLAARTPRGISLDLNAVEFLAVFSSVVLPTWNVTRVFHSRLRDGASIVNVGSLWGLVSPKPSLYLDLANEPAVPLPAAKAAVMQLSNYLAVLLADRAIRVNNLVPGWFPANRGKPRSDYIDGIVSNIPLARIGKPEDLSAAVLFMLGDGSSYMTGQSIVIDGGYSAW